MLKLASKVSFHQNISTIVKKLQTFILFTSNGRKSCLCYSLFYLVWWPCFLIISKQCFCWFLPKYMEYSQQILPHIKSQKNMTKLLVQKSQYVWEKNGGLMLCIMSGTFKDELMNDAMKCQALSLCCYVIPFLTALKKHFFCLCSFK